MMVPAPRDHTRLTAVSQWKLEVPVPTIKVLSEMNARVRALEAAVGAEVAAGDTLLVLECMKMEIPVEAPRAGRVSQILVAADAEIVDGQALVILET